LYNTVTRERDTLKELYDLLAESDPDKGPGYKKLREILPSHTVIYARAAIEAHTGIRLSYEDAQNYLESEGLLANKDYDIPKWYVDKWLNILPKAMSDNTSSRKKS
jgi:hypothetical protein